MRKQKLVTQWQNTASPSFQASFFRQTFTTIPFQMLGQHRDGGGSHVSATTWREYARNNTIILKNVMKVFLEDKLNNPLEVLVAINTILMIFSGLEVYRI